MFGLLVINAIITTCFCVEIRIDTKNAINYVGEKFASVTVDTGIMVRHWQAFDPSSAKVLTLAKALSPSYLRFGGTYADLVLFENDEKNGKAFPYKTDTAKAAKSVSSNLTENWDFEPLPEVKSRSKRDIGYIISHRDDTNFTMTAGLYDELHQFASAARFDLVFDLNVMLRSNGRWNPDNARELMEYTVKKGYPMAGWELGNEPNAYYRQWGIRIEPEQLAKDFQTLKEMTSNFTAFDHGIILGPSTTQLNKKRTIEYFKSFLKSGGGAAVTSVCFHQYYVDKRTATLDQFIDPEILNTLIHEVTTGYTIKNQTTKNTQLWLGETSSAWGAGAKGLSDRYVAGFMWLDKLGISAKFGVDVVVRQAFYGGHYALLQQNTKDPLPFVEISSCQKMQKYIFEALAKYLGLVVRSIVSLTSSDYWLTLLFKKLVGSKVLSVTSPNFKGKLRAYAHCANTKTTKYKPGSVVVYAMNLNNYDVSLTFPDIVHKETDLHVYLLEPENKDLLASIRNVIPGPQCGVQDDISYADTINRAKQVLESGASCTTQVLEY